MKHTYRFSLGCISVLLSAAAFGSHPLAGQVMEEIVVTAAYPEYLRMEEIVVTAPRLERRYSEEIVVTAPKPANVLVEDVTQVAGLTDQIAFVPQIDLSL